MHEPSPTPIAGRRVGLSLAVAAVIVAAGLLLLAGGLLRGLVAGSAGPTDTRTEVPVAIDASGTLPATTAVAPGPDRSQAPGQVPATPADPVLVGAGDIADCDAAGDEATAALVERLPGIVFTLGDSAYESGSEANFRDCYAPGWGRFLGRTRFAALGNHEYQSDDAVPAKAYFGEAAVRDGATWFSEDVGAWHVIVLDANCGEHVGGCGPESAQLRWLRDDLAASRAACTLALWHQPRFSSGEHGNDDSVAPFWEALYAADADLVLNGHDHDYERFAPQDPDGNRDPDRGITQVVVGTGGRALRGFEGPARNAVVRSSLAFGVLELTLQPRGWSFRFVSTDGSFSDHGRGSCH